MKYKKTNNCKKKKIRVTYSYLYFQKIQLITNLTLEIERTFERKRFKLIWNKKKNTDKIMRSALNEWNEILD